jgi:hypothetical protein
MKGVTVLTESRSHGTPEAGYSYTYIEQQNTGLSPLQDMAEFMPEEMEIWVSIGGRNYDAQSWKADSVGPRHPFCGIDVGSMEDHDFIHEGKRGSVSP